MQPPFLGRLLYFVGKSHKERWGVISILVLGVDEIR
jgi:hypothetical protein